MAYSLPSSLPAGVAEPAREPGCPGAGAGTGGASADDGRLLERFVALRDQAAFEVLVRRHGPMVLGVCRRVLGDAHDAEEAFQATFLVLVRKARAVYAQRELGPWLHGVASRTARKARAMGRRRRAREKCAADLADFAGAPADLPDGPSGGSEGGTEGGATDWPAFRSDLDAALARLPGRYRDPIILCDLQGQSRRQAAEALGLAEGTLSSRLARGRQLLRGRLLRPGRSAGRNAAGAPPAGLVPGKSSPKKVQPLPAPVIAPPSAHASHGTAGSPGTSKAGGPGTGGPAGPSPLARAFAAAAVPAGLLAATVKAAAFAAGFPAAPAGLPAGRSPAGPAASGPPAGAGSVPGSIPAAAAAGVISARTAALTQGVLRAMLFTKIKIVALAGCALVLAGAGTGVLAHRALAGWPAASVHGSGGITSLLNADDSWDDPLARAVFDKVPGPEQGDSVSAVVKAVDAERHTLTVGPQTKGAGDTTYDLPEGVKVQTAGRQKGERAEARLGDLAPGTRVELRLVPGGNAVADIVIMPQTFAGMVKNVDAAGHTITLVTKGKDGPAERTFALDPEAKAVVPGAKKGQSQEIPLADLKGGAPVRLTLTPDLKSVLGVEVGRAGVHGQVKGVDLAAGSITVSVKDKDGQADRTYPVAGDVRITLPEGTGEPATLADVKAGAPVSLELSAPDNKTVAAINVHPAPAGKGGK